MPTRFDFVYFIRFAAGDRGRRPALMKDSHCSPKDAHVQVKSKHHFVGSESSFMWRLLQLPEFQLSSQYQGHFEHFKVAKAPQMYKKLLAVNVGGACEGEVLFQDYLCVSPLIKWWQN